MERHQQLGDGSPVPPAHWGDSSWLAGVAFGLRLAHLISLRGLATFDSLIMDEAYQFAWAARIAAGDWVGQEAFFRAPLHAYMLALIRLVAGGGTLAPRLVQILLGTAGVVLLHRIGLRLGSRAEAATAALLAAACWPMIFFDTELLTVSLEVLLSLAAIFLLLHSTTSHRRWLVVSLAGLALGLAADTRPNMLVFLPGAAFWVAWPETGPRRKTIAASLLVAGALTAILPVTVRNMIVGGDFVLIASQGGVNFYIGNNQDSDGTTAVVPGTRPTWEGGYHDAMALARQARGSDLSPSEISRYWYGRGLTFWRERPGAALALTARKMLLLLGGDEVSNNKDLTFFRGLSPVLSLPLPAGFILIPLGIAGWTAAWRRHPDRRRSLALPLLFAIPYAGTIVAFFVTSRYRVPLLPVFCLGTAWFAAEVLRQARSWRWGALAAWCLPATALALLLNAGIPGYQDDPAQGHLAMATALSAEGRFEAALEEYDRAIAAGGAYQYEALFGRGQVLLFLGRRGPACGAFGESAKLRPDSTDGLIAYLTCSAATGSYGGAREVAVGLAVGRTPEVAASIHFTIGSLDERLGLQRESETQYRLGLSAVPDHFACRMNLALLLRRQGRLDESLMELRRAARAHPLEPIAQVQLANHFLALGDEVSARWHADRTLQLGGEIDGRLDALLARKPIQREGKNLMSAPR